MFTQVTDWLVRPDKRHKSWILFTGDCGTGKTTMLLALESMWKLLKLKEDFPFNVVTAFRIPEVYKDSKTYPDFAYDFCRMHGILGIDDLGKEALQDRYKTGKPTEEMLAIRYAERRPTYITTNLSMSAIRFKYGDYIADRLSEMCEIVECRGVSFRQKT